MYPPIRHTKTIRVSVTRPTNTDAYQAKDAIGTAASSLLTFTNAGRRPSKGTGLIHGGALHTDKHDGTAADFQLWLFSAAPTAAADNAAFTPTAAQMQASFIGVLLFTAERESAEGRVYNADAMNPLAFECGEDTRDLYGVLVAVGAYTPANAEVFTVALHVDQD